MGAGEPGTAGGAGELPWGAAGVAAGVGIKVTVLGIAVTMTGCSGT